jgi:lipid-A-disaccharide synthase
MNALVVTGERSAENYASILVDELGSLDSDIHFFSVCSDILDKKTKKIADFREISVIGAKEALSIAGKAFKLLKKIKKSIVEHNIDLVILMDFPEFNMRILKFAHKLGKKTVYYISPQVWAWRAYRINALFKYSSLVVPILPFEKTYFNINKVESSKIAYIGHPLVDVLHDKMNGRHKREKRIIIMPGSRKSEIEYNYKVMFDAAKIIENRVNGFEFVWVVPEYIEKGYIEQKLIGYDFISISHDAHALMKHSYFGILKSGTTTLEAAMLNLPMVVSYKISKASYLIGRLLVRGIKYISLPNLILGRGVVKELIADDATADAISGEFLRLYNNPDQYKSMQHEFSIISYVLGDYPVTYRIAKEIYSIL